MNGRKLAQLICEWADANKIDRRDLEQMTFIELMDKLNEDKY